MKWILSLLTATVMQTGLTASAQTYNRVTEQVVRDPGKPGPEDFALYLRNSSFYDMGRKSSRAVKDPVKMIGVIKGKLEGKLPPAKEAQLLLQLAELYRDAADQETEELVGKYGKKYQKWIEGTVKDAPAYSGTGPGDYLLSQVKTYRTLLQKNPKFEKQPDLLFHLALALIRVNSANANIYLEKLQKEFPKSKWAAAAALASAEQLFYQSKFDDARKIYLTSEKSSNKLVQYYARYKAGWIDSYAGAKNPALRNSGYDKLEKTAQIATGKKGYRDLLADEAANDLVWFWSENYEEARAKAFFKGKREELYFLTLERIAWKHETAGKPKNAVAVYTQIAAQAPTRVRAPLTDARLMQLLLAGGDFPALAQLIDRIHQQYRPDGAWFKRHNGQDIAKSVVPGLLKDQSYLAANKMHDALSGGNRAALAPTLASSARILATFPKGDQSYMLRFRYASALETGGKTMDAATAYLEVAKSDEMDSRYREAASKKMIAVQSAYVASLKLKPGPAPGSLLKEAKIPAPQRLLVEIIDVYTGFFNDHPQVASYLLTAAKTETDYGHYKSAVIRFDKLVSQHPSSPEAFTAIRTVTEIHTRQKEWVKLIAVSRNYLKRDVLTQTAGVQSHLRQSLRTGMWEKAKDELAKGEALVSAKSFMEFQAEFPKDPEADSALSFATTIYADKGKGKDASSAGMLLTSTYPASKYRPNVMAKVAGVQEEMLEFASAAAVYQAFAQSYPRDRRAADALKKSVFHFIQSGSGDNATSALALLTKGYPTTAEAAAAQERYARFLETNDEFFAAAKAWETQAQLVRSAPDEVLFAQAKAAWLLDQVVEERPAAQARMASLAAQLTKLPVARAQGARGLVAGYMMRAFDEKILELSSFDIEFSNKIDFAASSERLAKQLADLEAQQRQILAVGSTERTPEGLFKLATCYELAIKAYQGSPIESEFSAADLHALDSAKEQKVFAYKTALLKNFELSYAAAGSGGSYNEWRVLAHKKLAKLKPEKYVDISETILRPQYTEVHLSRSGKAQ
jgi:TolA-binding protein